MHVRAEGSLLCCTVASSQEGFASLGRLIAKYPKIQVLRTLSSFLSTLFTGHGHRILLFCLGRFRD